MRKVKAAPNVVTSKINTASHNVYTEPTTHLQGAQLGGASQNGSVGLRGWGPDIWHSCLLRIQFQ